MGLETHNVWGFACVKLTLGRTIIHVGTDDADELAKFVAEKVGDGGFRMIESDGGQDLSLRLL